jgi:putative phosphoribosyl transferase
VDVLRRAVTLASGGVSLPGDLAIPEQATAVVVFAHGSGSSRRSPRNVQVAERLQVDGFGTLAFDLLTDVEARDRGKVFDIALLASRLEGTVGWLRGEKEAGVLRIAFFGASTGAAAALVAAAHLAGDVAAVVSRGGRPDLAGEALAAVTAPTLLIVGGADRQVLELNRQAQARMRCETRLEIVPGATHLFEEPGALERVAELAAAWFADHAGRTPTPRRAPSPARPARRSRR